MRVGSAPFADLVFHVLAHVPLDLAASAWDATYVAWCAARLGPASERALGEDVAALAGAVATHDALVRAQLVAWLFDDLTAAAARFERALSELAPEEVAAPELLPLVAGDRGAELVWCAVALEAEHHARLPASPPAEALAGALDGVRAAAPALARHEVCAVRALRLRGRVRGGPTRGVIWVGAPDGDVGPSAEHAAWQAAHEATVAEVGDHDARDRDARDRDAREREARLGFDDLEHAAVALLAARADEVGLAASHARWLAALTAPDPRAEALSPRARAVYDTLRRAGALSSG